MSCQGGSVIKNLPAMQEMCYTQVQFWVREDPWIRDLLLQGHLLLYSGLGSSTDRGALRATIHGVAKSQDTTGWLSMHQVTESYENPEWEQASIAHAINKATAVSSWRIGGLCRSVPDHSQPSVQWFTRWRLFKHYEVRSRHCVLYAQIPVFIFSPLK